ncbi:DNA repair protein RAD57 [Xylaria nigripes]|nr:DNA repair protein RAD57 [Xylaria nigripes]
MTDLLQVLPGFPIAQYDRLLLAIERCQLTVTDLLTLEVPDIGKRTKLPLLHVKSFRDAILAALHTDLGVAGPKLGDEQKQRGQQSSIRVGALRQTGTELLAQPWRTISTLDTSLDAALGGGVPTGYITEFTGESGAGKTQFLLTLALSVQLPPPHGLGRPALYISTESALSTKRLLQILQQNPFFRTLDPDIAKPSLDGIKSTVTPDLESQDHILTYQVPVEVARQNIGLIILDSVAANYRAEFDRGKHGSNMAARSVQLVRLGHLLRGLAQKHELAVVVANQVADRFPGSIPTVYPSATFPHSPSYGAAIKNTGSGTTPTTTPGPQNRHTTHIIQTFGAASQESPLAARSRNISMATAPLQDIEPTSSTEDIIVRASMPRPPPEDFAPAPAALLLDHQQRWFTGWGDDPAPPPHETLKTPSLGLVWTTQIAARIALFRRPAYGRKEVIENPAAAYDDYDDAPSMAPYIKSWRRWMKVVFAPHVPGTGTGLEGAVEFEVVAGGLRGLERGGNKREKRGLDE